MMKIDLGEQLETMIGIAAEASDKVRRWLDEGRALDPENKPSGEPVTALDKAVNEFIHERMAARLDGPVIGEEDEASTQSEAVALGSVFYVDPNRWDARVDSGQRRVCGHDWTCG